MADYWENWGPSPGKALQVLLHELCLKKGWKVSYVKLNPFGNLQSVEALNSPATTMKEAEPFEANPQQYLYELHLFQGSEQPTVFQNLEPRNLKGEAKADLAEQCLIHRHKPLLFESWRGGPCLSKSSCQRYTNANGAAGILQTRKNENCVLR
jgi:hypothetical protein